MKKIKFIVLLIMLCLFNPLFAKNDYNSFVDLIKNFPQTVNAYPNEAIEWTKKWSSFNFDTKDNIRLTLKEWKDGTVIINIGGISEFGKETPRVSGRAEITSLSPSRIFSISQEQMISALQCIKFQSKSINECRDNNETQCYISECKLRYNEVWKTK